MITIRKAELDDVENIIEEFGIILMSRSEKIDFKKTMILSERDEIYGITSYISRGENAFINILFIIPEYRGMHFGDGIIKALLNLMDKEGIKTVYIEFPKTFEGFLKKLGMKRFEDRLRLKKLFNVNLDKKSVIYMTKLPDFFETACRSKRKN